MGVRCGNYSILINREKCKDTIVSLHDLIGTELEMSRTGNVRYPGLANRTMGNVIAFLINMFIHAG